MIPESEADSEVEVLSRGFGKLTNIDGKMLKRRKNKEEEIIYQEDTPEEEIIEEEEDIKEEEPFPPKFGDLQSIRERCKALVGKIGRAHV